MKEFSNPCATIPLEHSKIFTKPMNEVVANISNILMQKLVKIPL
jgi:hypothetical protein